MVKKQERNLIPGEIVGFKRIISEARSFGRYKYYHVECLLCHRVTKILYRSIIENARRGCRGCKECGKEPFRLTVKTGFVLNKNPDKNPDKE